MDALTLRIWRAIWEDVTAAEGNFDASIAEFALIDGEYLGQLKARFSVSDEELQEIAEYLYSNVYNLDYNGERK